jgi:predicted transcriptional regulator
LAALWGHIAKFIIMTRKGGISFEEERQLLELARASKSLEEAARATGRKPETIKKVAKRLGVSFKPRSTKSDRATR